MKANDDGTAAFFFQWATEMSGTFLEDRGIDTKFPRAYGFFKRYQGIVDANRDSPNCTLVQGTEVMSLLKAADFAEASMVVEEDPTRLRANQTVAVSRTDDISRHKDIGTLIALSASESVIEIGGNSTLPLRVHCPRRNFMVQAV
jgi:hypothetical protein